MTPVLFRRKAHAHLTSAKLLIATCPAQAWYLAGYAIEFSLKAKICVTRGWDCWPATRREATERNKKQGRTSNEDLFVHDLDKLLYLSESIFIKRSSFRAIDWNKALRWSEQIRYANEADISVEMAKLHIIEIEKVIEELEDHELIRGLLRVDKRVTDSFGRFDCVALSKSIAPSRRDIILSWRAPTPKTDLFRREAFLNALEEEVDEDLREKISRIEFFPFDDPLMQGLFALTSSFSGPIYQEPRIIIQGNIIEGFPPFPNAYLITACSWKESDLIDDWKNKNLI